MTNDSNQTLERIAQRVSVPEPAYDRLFCRRDRKDRNRRITTAVVVAVLVLLSITGLVHAFGGQNAGPATEPTPTPGNPGIFSGMGGWIAYGSSSGDTYGGSSGIRAMDPQRPGIKVRLSAHSGEPLAWSSDGSKLLILRMRSPRNSALYVLNANGSETLLINARAGHGLAGASFSPDGSKVVFAYGTFNGSDSGIYVVDAHGGTPRRLLEARPLPIYGPGVRSELGDPAFSPDGSQIAYFDGLGDHDNTLRVMNADGSGSRVLLGDTGVMKSSAGLRSLGWFPDGSRLVFGMGYGPYSIYVVGADGSGLTRLMDGSHPDLSPDGSRIAYGQGDSYGAGPLAIADADGTHVHVFTYASPGPWNPLPRATSSP